MRTLAKIVVLVALVAMFIVVSGCRKGYYRGNDYNDYGFMYGFMYWDGRPYYDYDGYVSRHVWNNYWRPSYVGPGAYRPCPPGFDYYQSRQSWGNYWRPSQVSPHSYSPPSGPDCGTQQAWSNFWRQSPVCPPNYSRPPCR